MDGMQGKGRNEGTSIWTVTLVDDNGMDHKLGTKGTQKKNKNGCKRNEERDRSYRQGKKWGWCFYFSSGHYKMMTVTYLHAYKHCA